VKRFFIALRSHDGSGVVASIIANGTYGEVNHSSIEFVNDRIVVEAHIKQGVIVRPAETDGKVDTIHRFVFAVTEEEYTAALEFAREQAGKPYDKAAIIRFIPGLRRFVKSDREEGGRWICSELAEAILRKAGLGTVRADIKAESVSPQDQFKSIRCDYRFSEGPEIYARIEKGVVTNEYVKAA
jgi:hypothetical protein